MAGLGSVGAGCGGAGTAPDSSTATEPTPVFGQAVVLRPISGTVQIRLPGRSTVPLRLTAPRAVPLGTVVDTTAGRVSLTSANPTPGPTQTGQFFRGSFRVEQSRASAGLVDLVVRDNLSRRTCAALSPRVLGLLRGTAKGRFRTTGRFAAATVRGTDWGVRDRCDGTLTVVRTGVVVVRDFRLHRDVTVRAGQTYLAKAR
jgi:hypothetical protein